MKQQVCRATNMPPMFVVITQKWQDHLRGLMMNSVGHIKSNDDEINSRELTPPNDIKNQFTWIDNE